MRSKKFGIRVRVGNLKLVLGTNAKQGCRIGKKIISESEIFLFLTTPWWLLLLLKLFSSSSLFLSYHYAKKTSRSQSSHLTPPVPVPVPVSLLLPVLFFWGGGGIPVGGRFQIGVYVNFRFQVLLPVSTFDGFR